MRACSGFLPKFLFLKYSIIKFDSLWMESSSICSTWLSSNPSASWGGRDPSNHQVQPCAHSAALHFCGSSAPAGALPLTWREPSHMQLFLPIARDFLLVSLTVHWLARVSPLGATETSSLFWDSSSDVSLGSFFFFKYYFGKNRKTSNLPS